MDALETSVADPEARDVDAPSATVADEIIAAENVVAQGEENETVSEEESRVIELVGFLVQGIVEHPDEVEVEEFFDSAGLVYGVRVHPDDVGRVIGRDGRVAGALRNVAKAAATKIGTHVSVEILTEDD